MLYIMNRGLFAIFLSFYLLNPVVQQTWKPATIDSGFSIGQCTNYAAHAREDLWKIMQDHWAGDGFWNAGNWDGNFQYLFNDGNSEYVVDDIPEAGAIVVFDTNLTTQIFDGKAWRNQIQSGNYGHVGYVTSKLSDDEITINDQNADNKGGIRIGVRMKVVSGMHFIHSLVYSRQVYENRTGGPSFVSEEVIVENFSILMPIRNIAVFSASEFILSIDGINILSSQRPSTPTLFRKTLWLNPGNHTATIKYWRGKLADGSQDIPPKFSNTAWPATTASANEENLSLPVSYMYYFTPASSSVGDPVTIYANANLWEASDRIIQINISIDNQSLGSISGKSGNILWDTKGYSPGTHILTLTAKIDGYTGAVKAEVISYQLSGQGETPPPPPTGASKPSLSSPGNGSSLVQSTEVNLVWNSVSNATQYTVEVWGGPYSMMVPCDWQGGTSCKIGQMWPGMMSWHVKARNSSGQETDWSDTWTFTIQETPPPPTTGADRPSLSSPGNGSSMAQSTEVNLVWNNAANATQYKVELWGGPYSTMVPCDWQGGTSCKIGQMWPGTMSWHVKARNGSGQETDWSDTWTFTIQNIPTQPPPPPPPPPTNCYSWTRGARVGLRGGAEIREGSALSYRVHTIVPNDDWLMDIIDGPRSADGKTWWDMSRKALDGGGTGWVYIQQAGYNVCP